MKRNKEECIMRAACYDSHGGQTVRRMREDYPMPTRRKGWVLVKIMAAGVNPVDYKLCRGDVPSILVPKPKIFGGDLAGVVVECDADSKKFKKGDKVFGMMEYKYTKWGTYAEMACVRESALARMPKNLSFPEAACLPLVTLTSIQALRRGGICEKSRGQLKGKRILIHAGSGGVGSVAIQLARHFGLYVITTCSAKNAAFAKSLGANEVVDYRAQKFEEELKNNPVDFVFDVMGADIEKRSHQIIKQTKGSAYMTILTNGMFEYFEGWGRFKKPAAYTWGLGHYSWKLTKQLFMGPAYSVTIVQPCGEDMEYARDLVEKGILKPQLAKTYPFNRFNEALSEVAEGHCRGKLAIEIAGGGSGGSVRDDSSVSSAHRLPVIDGKQSDGADEKKAGGMAGGIR